MATDRESLDFWDAESVARRHSDWMTLPGVRAYLNTKIGGTEHDWPVNWLVRFLDGRRLPRALSIGCGTGALERDLMRRGITDRIDAFDGSTASIAHAQAASKEEGFNDSIRYFVADFNEPFLTRSTYDAVFSTTRCITSRSSRSCSAR